MNNVFDFSTALNMMKEGKRMHRVGWNGKGQWVTMIPGQIIDPSSVNKYQHHLVSIARQNGELVIKPYFHMKLVDDSILIGWIPTATDLIAEDWKAV